MYLNRWRKLTCLIVVILVTVVGCKKDVSEDELIAKDTSDMALLESYNYYYYIDYNQFTINWYDGADKDFIIDLKDSFPADKDYSTYELELETIYDDTLWFRIVKNRVIYGVVKADLYGHVRGDFYDYYPWEPKILTKRYILDPVDEIILFDNVAVYEDEENYGLYKKNDTRAALFYNKLFSGSQLDNIVLAFNGTDINYKYDSDEGLSYLLANESKINQMSLSEIENANVTLYDYSTYEEFFDANNRVLVDSTLAKNHLYTLNQNVMLALSQEKYSLLANYVHESKGLRLIPFDRIAGEDAIFSGDYLKKYESKTYKDLQYFGYINDKGRHMLMTLDQYYDYYLYPIEYSNITPSYNNFSDDVTKFLVEDTSIKYYDNPIIVHYQYKVGMGIGNQNLGNKNRSIKLVYEYIDNEWYLVMIMNNEYSI